MCYASCRRDPELKTAAAIHFTGSLHHREGARVQTIRYQANFSYMKKSFIDRDGEQYWALVVEDVKSRATKTRMYEMKKKLMRENFNIEIQEV